MLLEYLAIKPLQFRRSATWGKTSSISHVKLRKKKSSLNWAISPQNCSSRNFTIRRLVQVSWSPIKVEGGNLLKSCEVITKLHWSVPNATERLPAKPRVSPSTPWRTLVYYQLRREWHEIEKLYHWNLVKFLRVFSELKAFVSFYQNLQLDNFAKFHFELSTAISTLFQTFFQ